MMEMVKPWQMYVYLALIMSWCQILMISWLQLLIVIIMATGSANIMAVISGKVTAYNAISDVVITAASDDGVATNPNL